MSQPFPGQFPQPQQPQYPENSNALLALILGIANFVVCGFLGPFAWYIGSKEIAAIDMGRRDPTKRDQANAGRILGIIGTVLLALGLLALVVFIAIVIAGAASS